ncbi:TPA: terminase small subunit [Klebsiella pneumoniae subsp. pneumoniae]|nr:terminase small subunit [Klebsiella pneumoniae subsp. pneumoniae]
MPVNTVLAVRLRIEYLIDFNVTKARGGSEKTANEQGARLLANVSISQRISGLKSERNERNKINADFIPR